MDIVNLESSGGYLNTWRYGFDPNDHSNEKVTPKERELMLKAFYDELEKISAKEISEGKRNVTGEVLKQIQKSNQ